MTALARQIRTVMEVQENLAAWQAIFLERGYRDAAEVFGRPEAAGHQASRDQGESSSAADLTSRFVGPPFEPQAGSSQVGAETVPRSSGNSDTTPSYPAAETVAPYLDATPTYQRDAIASLRNDDPFTLTKTDIVGNDGAAAALARVIAWKHFTPPFAVGVFGPWGSGKSFFLRRVEDVISALSNDVSESAYHDNIVTIRFNAWHYVDADLWASLVGQIFEELDRRTAPSMPNGASLLDRLTTARELALESARALATRRREEQEAAEKLRVAEAALGATRDAVVSRMESLAQAAKSAIDTISADAQVKSFVEQTYGQSLGDLAVAWHEPKAAAQALQRDGAIWQKLFRDLGAPFPICCCLGAAILLLVLPMAASAFSGPLAAAIASLSPIGLALSGFLVSGAGWFAKITSSAVRVRDTVVGAVEAYKNKVDQLREEARADLVAEKQAVDAAVKKVEAARIALDLAIRSQVDAASEFARERPAERLRTFVRTRAAVDGPYRSRQGLVSTIRRDFGDLAGLLRDMQSSVAEGHEPKLDVPADERAEDAIRQLRQEFGGLLSEDELATLSVRPVDGYEQQEPIDRIVLLIDDLDRCPADKVLDVLQAVHLLMAFPLFVVIVAVDVRWLEGALTERFRQFSLGSHAPEPLEYLEKVFQLAIWTRSLNQRDIEEFIRIRVDAGQDFSLDMKASESQSISPAGEDNAGASGEIIARTKVQDEEPAEFDDREPSRTETDAEILRSDEAIRITPNEAAFLRAVAAPLGMTPRRLLRLINSYKVARASLEETGSEAFALGGYRAFAALLALSVAYPERTAEILDLLERETNLESLLENLAARIGHPSYPRIAAWGTALAAGGAPVTVQDLKDDMDLVLRFSFAGSSARNGGDLPAEPVRISTARRSAG